MPDEITVSIVQDRLTKDDCKNGFILDGFPRTLSQSKSLDNALNEMGITLGCVINFDVPDEVIIKRLGRNGCKKASDISRTDRTVIRLLSTKEYFSEHKCNKAY